MTHPIIKKRRGGKQSEWDGVALSVGVSHKKARLRVYIRPHVLKQLSLKAGDKVDCSYIPTTGRLMVRPGNQYTLTQMSTDSARFDCPAFDPIPNGRCSIVEPLYYVTDSFLGITIPDFKINTDNPRPQFKKKNKVVHKNPSNDEFEPEEEDPQKDIKPLTDIVIRPRYLIRALSWADMSVRELAREVRMLTNSTNPDEDTVRQMTREGVPRLYAAAVKTIMKKKGQSL